MVFLTSEQLEDRLIRGCCAVVQAEIVRYTAFERGELSSCGDIKAGKRQMARQRNISVAVRRQLNQRSTACVITQPSVIELV